MNKYATENWVNGVADEGIFIKPISLQERYDVSHIPSNWQIESKNIPLTLMALENDSKIGFYFPSNCQIKYKTSNINWENYTNDKRIVLSEGEKIQFLNETETLSTSSSYYAYFTMSGEFKAYGNIQSLLNYSNSVQDYCFYKLFFITKVKLKNVI